MSVVSYLRINKMGLSDHKTMHAWIEMTIITGILIKPQSDFVGSYCNAHRI
jgi:hypothetical protein